MSDENMSMDMFNTPNQFQFSAIEMDNLGAQEYTIVNMLVDETSSVDLFKNELEDCMKIVVESCRKHPTAEQLLMRCAAFNASYNNDEIREIHGFNTINAIDTDTYVLQPGGMTPLWDATLDSIETTRAYADTLNKQDYFCNGILFVITDGGENRSSVATMSKIKDAVADIRQAETLESVKMILIGVNDDEDQLKQMLNEFKDEAGFDDYISLGDVTPSKLAKLADWISQSISSASQNLGNGGPSQNVNFNL